jgi:asparagine synthase (glutamine-hydrolysing)
MILKLIKRETNIVSADIRILHFDGTLWYKDKLLNSSEMLELFKKEEDDIFNTLKCLNGFYSLVFSNNNKFYMVVDRVRSKPLFYSKTESGIVISENAHKIKEALNLKQYDETKVDEFLTSGFIIGDETFYSEIKQIEAGTYIIYDQESGILSKKSYFEYRPDYPTIKSEHILLKKLDSTLDKAFNRLIKFANGRKIVVPLSGGLDSRLVVSMLKRKKYNNVLCFSYGKKGNTESLKSKKIAESLGFEWIFIEYTRKNWRNTFQSKEFKDYFFQMDNLCSLVHIQDFIAVKELKENNIIPEDAIFVPGHTGDFISGGHIPSKYKNSSVTKDELISDIIAKHFRVNDFNKLRKKSQERIKNRIVDLINIHDDKVITNIYASSLYELFDWRERQTKHVINSVRIYDYYNMQWFLPLWDNEVIEFWLTISIVDKIDKKLYKKYLADFDTLNLFSKTNTCYVRSSIKQYFFENKTLKYFVYIYKYLKKYWLKLMKQYTFYYKHPLQWYGIFSYTKVITKRKFQNIYSFLVDYYLEGFK